MTAVSRAKTTLTLYLPNGGLTLVSFSLTSDSNKHWLHIPFYIITLKNRNIHVIQDWVYHSHAFGN